MKERKWFKPNGRTYKWLISKSDPALATSLTKTFRIKPLVARIMAARGITDADDTLSFIKPKLGSTQPPEKLPDMKKAVERLVCAIRKNEKICVYGDYDVDGITSTVLVLRFFKWLGKEADYYIPNRVSEGYGLNKEAIRRIAEDGAGLLITVDNGISSIEEVAYANSIGLDVIVTDHHRPGATLPGAVAVVNPKREPESEDFTPLAGVGVAFKLVHATCRALDMDAAHAKPFLGSLLDLVALGTVADIVPLVGENRIFVKHGIKRISETKKVGLSTLLQLSSSSNRELTPNVISYQVAPRLNAAGRADEASIGVELLLTEDSLKAVELSRQLNRLNEDRRNLETDILNSCLSLMEREAPPEDQKILILQGEGWHIGVVGIVASRLQELYYKPVIVLAMENGVARGSGRSIRGFDIYQALNHCRDLLEAYGGHKMAVGLTIDREKIPEFIERINRYAADKIGEKIMKPVLTIDGEVKAEELTLENVADLSILEPHGSANPYPVLYMKNVSLLEKPRIVGKNHLKLMMCQDGISIPGIGFSKADAYPELDDEGAVFSVAFTPFINEWRGYTKVEAEIKDIKFD